MLFGKALKNAEGYSEKHLRCPDYYEKGKTVEGEWIGLACVEFGVKEGCPVLDRDFESLRKNQHAQTTRQITQRHNTTRLEWVIRRTPTGIEKFELKPVSNRRVAFDFTLSMPKTFSILGVTAGDARVWQWHDKAVRKTFKEMERLATRIDSKGGQKIEEVTGKVAAARYDHPCNRSLEPNIHSHIVIFNMTPGSDGKYYGLESRVWMDRAKYLTGVYRDCLASEAKKAGIGISVDRFGAPQIAEIEDLIPLFSQRTDDIHALIETAEEIAGTTLTAAEVKRLVFASRGLDLDKFSRSWQNKRAKLESAFIDSNGDQTARRRLLGAFEAIVRDCSDGGLTEISTEAVLAMQRDLLDPEQLARLDRFVHRTAPDTRCIGKTTDSVNWAVQHLFERLSVVRDYDILAAALNYAQGSDLDLAELRAILANHPDLIVKGSEVTTKTHLQRETEILQWIADGKQKGVKLPKLENSKLNVHQLRAVNELLNSDEQFTVLCGKAGTGKTVSLEEFIGANVQAGHRVIALAPSTKSRDVIPHHARHTLQRFLVDKAKHLTVRPNDLIVVDEAGFASVEQIHKLLGLARGFSWRVCLVGDTRQHSSIEAGDGLRIMLERTQIKREWLDKIVRQRPDAMEGRYLKAAAFFSKGKTVQGFAILDRAGAIHVARGQDRIDQMAAIIVAEKMAGRSVVCVNPSHRENDAVNAAVRKLLKENGTLGESIMINAYRTLGWTLAERQQISRLRPGLILEVTQGPDKGEAWRVVKVESDKALATRNGVIRAFDARNAECWAVCSERTMEISCGDEIVTHCGMKTGRGGELINGEKFTVAGFRFHGAHACPVTTDGKIVETRNLAHAYASTSVASQGATAESVVFGIDRKSVSWATGKIAYVSATRGRSKIWIFAEAKADLVQLGQENRQGDRKAALDLVQTSAKREVGIKV